MVMVVGFGVGVVRQGREGTRVVFPQRRAATERAGGDKAKPDGSSDGVREVNEGWTKDGQRMVRLEKENVNPKSYKLLAGRCGRGAIEASCGCRPKCGRFSRCELQRFPRLGNFLSSDSSTNTLCHSQQAGRYLLMTRRVSSVPRFFVHLHYRKRVPASHTCSVISRCAIRHHARAETHNTRDPHVRRCQVDCLVIKPFISISQRLSEPMPNLPSFRPKPKIIYKEGSFHL
ncbi:hypothetical protein K432DRAFT_21552 [Lepidopterella palustris CBS 459.81]|uniref:Uncharacterized protein n=1 Tax=Lepidopterella palustris CBS 459.81 TaxID=1314670 RepID=A0A8E2ECK1_9PEZI|nr:hypothetical protein K432DRAFT_21552 [Lepidopterella palustris CBS 459.81]